MDPLAAEDCPAVTVDDPNVQVFGLLLEAHARLTRNLDARLRADAGMSLQTLEVLLRVGRAPAGWVPVSALADTVALTSGGVTRLVDRLESEGLLSRERCHSDARVVELRLTEAGVTRLREALDAHLVHLTEEVGSPLAEAGADTAALGAALDVLRGGPAAGR
jgi:DNA-binding MarR family transcriptional regulator